MEKLVWKGADNKFLTMHPMTGETIPIPSTLAQIWEWCEGIRGEMEMITNQVTIMQLELVKLAGERWDKKNS